MPLENDFGKAAERFRALKIFCDFNFSGQDKLIFTMDITSLYTVIPNSEGLQALKHFFDQRTVKEPSSETLLRLAELVLTLNCFSFAGNYYKQINGVAMGTKMGPSYANLFVGYVEHQFFNQYNGAKPELYGRYIDDCIGAISSSREELGHFITSVNSFHPALKYTWEISETSLAFLDINVSISGNVLCTSMHYKPTDSHSYLLYSSSHPSHVKNSIPYSQFLRLRRLCSDDSNFSSKSEMCQFFEKRGYPVSVVKAGHHRAQQFDRQSSLQTSQKDKNDRIPFTLTFHPHNHAVKSIILNNFKLLQNDPETGRIFSQPPLISFKRDKNVGNFLVRSALKTNAQPALSNARAHDAKLVFSLLTLARYRDLSDLLRSPIVSRVPPQMSFIAQPVRHAINDTLARQVDDYVTDSTNTFAMLRRMTRIYLSPSLVILISLTTPKNTWLSAAFPYI